MMNTDIMKQVYLLAQKHCGLKVGDWVRVTRKAESRESGWDNPWVDDMDRAVGVVGNVVRLSAYGVSVYFPPPIINTWNLPYFVLEKVEKPAHEFKPFDKVLVRDSENNKWRCDFYSYRDNAGVHHCTGNCGWWQYCIPYEGNEHLVGTTDMPEE